MNGTTRGLVLGGMAIWLGLAVTIPAVARAEGSPQADILFKSGLGKYFAGDLSGAVTDLEDAVRYDPKDKKIKSFLVKVLVDSAARHTDRHDFKAALPYLEKAKKHAPESARVNELYQAVYAELHPAPAAGGSGAAGGGGAPADSGVLKDLFKSFSDSQEKIIETYTGPMKLLEKTINEQSKERVMLGNIIEKGQEASSQAIRRTVVFGLGGLAAGIVIVIAGIWLILHYVSVRREALLMQHQERILNMMQQQSLALTQGGGASPRLMLTQSSSTRQLIEDPNPLIRAKGVEVIEAELVEEKDSEVAERLLAPFLQDENNRVRANAAKAMYKYKPDVALKILREMIDAQDKWMRVSAVWALGEIGADDGAQILLDLRDDPEYHVRRRVYKSLQKFQELRKDDMSVELREVVDKAVRDLAITEQQAQG